MEKFGQKLRTLRERAGLSYRKLAVELDVSFTHLSNIESGMRRPSLDLAVKIADYFEVPLEDLIRDERKLRLK